MAVTRFIVTIDRLQLRGVAREDAPALVASLRSELERSLVNEAAGPRAWESATVAALRPPPVRVGGGPDHTGRALGRSLATELTR
jgi:hypothetical protein